MLWIDAAAIPKDAPNPDAAHALPRLHAGAQGRRGVERRSRGYANANLPATALLAKAITRQSADLSAARRRARSSTPITAGNAEQTRERTRLWTTIKTGRY